MAPGLTDATSVWSPLLAEAVPGLAQHFALAAEAKVASDTPMIKFLGQSLKGEAAGGDLAAPEAVAELLSK